MASDRYRNPPLTESRLHTSFQNLAGKYQPVKDLWLRSTSEKERTCASWPTTIGRTGG